METRSYPSTWNAAYGKPFRACYTLSITDQRDGANSPRKHAIGPLVATFIHMDPIGALVYHLVGTELHCTEGFVERYDDDRDALVFKGGPIIEITDVVSLHI